MVLLNHRIEELGKVVIAFVVSNMASHKVGETKQRVNLDPSHIGATLSDLAKTKIISERHETWKAIL